MIRLYPKFAELKKELNRILQPSKLLSLYRYITSLLLLPRPLQDNQEPTKATKELTEAVLELRKADTKNNSSINKLRRMYELLGITLIMLNSSQFQV